MNLREDIKGQEGSERQFWNPVNRVLQRHFQIGSNRVFKEEKDDCTVYYLPCYVRFKVKEITELDIEKLQGTLFGTLLFTFYYGCLDEKILEQFVDEGKKSIILHFGRQQSIQLKQEVKGVTVKHQHKRRMIDYVVRSSFTCRLGGDVFYTPFELINLYLSITIQSLRLYLKENNKSRRVEIKFNCMQSDQVIMLQPSRNKKFGNYRIANYFFDCQIKDEQKPMFKPLSVLRNKRQQQYKDNEKNSDSEDDNDDQDYDDGHPQIKNFQYAHFRITMYKYPGVNLISIFVPLWILGLINLFLFFQDRTLANRIAGIATLTLAFIAFIPTINDKIPQTPNIKLVEILVYMEAAASVLCLIQSYQGKDITDPYDWTTDGFFISALILNLLTFFIMLILFIVHKCFWQKGYIQKINKGKKEKDWNRQNWKNFECDSSFKLLIEENKIKIL